MSQEQTLPALNHYESVITSLKNTLCWLLCYQSQIANGFLSCYMAWSTVKLPTCGHLISGDTYPWVIR